MTTRTHERRRRVPAEVVGWAAFLLACAAVGPGKAAMDRARAERLADWQLRYHHESRLQQSARYDVDGRLWWFRANEPGEVEESLRLPLGTLAHVRNKGTQTATVPASAIKRSAQTGSVMLVFMDGSFKHAVLTLPPLPQRPDLALWRWGDRATNAVLFLAPFAWLGGLLAGFMERSRGVRPGEVAVMAAVLWGVAWLARPGMFEAPGGRMVLGVAFAATLFALAMLLWQRRHARVLQLHLCHHCGYDQRGSVSGVCPECGTVTYDGARLLLARRAADAAESVAHAVVDDEEPDADPTDSPDESLVVDEADPTAITAQR